MSTSPPPSRLLLPVLAVASGVGIIASAVYAPSVPAIIASLGASRDDVQATFTVYLITFAVGQLVVGPIVDRYGRRPMLIGGMALMAAASVGCALARSIDLLLAFRVIQALGGCTGAVITRAIVRDVYDGPNLTKAISGLAASIALSPAVAPMIGGLLQSWAGWQANFLLVGLIAGAVTVAVILVVPETRRHAAPAAGMLRGLFQSYHTLLTDLPFLAYAVAISGSSALFYAFTAAGPVLLIGSGQISPATYGWLAGLPPLGFMAGSFLTNRLSARLGLNALLLAGACWLLADSLTGLAFAATMPATAPLLFAVMIGVGLGNGLVMPNASIAAIGRHTRIAGAASALTGFTQMTGGALGTLAVMVVAHDTAIELMLVLSVSSAIVVAMAVLVSLRPGPRDGGNAPGGR